MATSSSAKLVIVNLCSLATPKRRLKAGERRAGILEAASEVFADRGYVGASIDRIAEAAGISAPVIYRHFGSKQRALHRAAPVERDGTARRHHQGGGP